MTQPQLSVVIATWHRPALLARCLQALIDQSLEKHDYEIIMVTDGPDEPTIQCIKRLLAQTPSHPFIKLISLPTKKGPAAARNAGWTAAKGQLIVFTDDDCIPTRFFLENYWNAWCLVGKTLIAFSGKVEVPLPPRPTDHQKNTAQLEKARFITANCACTPQTLRQVSGLDESFTMAWREDSALEFACRQNNIPIMEVPAAIVIHPARHAAWGVSIREQKKTMFNPLLYKKFPALYKRYIKGGPPWYYYAMVTLAFTSVAAAVTNITLIPITLIAWMALVAWFTVKRLRGTAKTASHILEMACTSLVIPFLSIAWHLYGTVKFKTLPV